MTRGQETTKPGEQEGLHLLRGTLLLALAGLRGKESRVDVRDDTTLADDNITEELVQPVSNISVTHEA